MKLLADARVAYGGARTFLGALPRMVDVCAGLGWTLDAALAEVVGTRGRYLLLWDIGDPDDYVASSTRLVTDPAYREIERELSGVVVSETTRMLVPAPFDRGIGLGDTARGDTFMVAEATVTRDGMRALTAEMDAVIDGLGRSDFALCGGYAELIGEVGAIVDLWRVPGPGAIAPAVRAARKDPAYNAAQEKVAALVLREQTTLAVRIR